MGGASIVGGMVVVGYKAIGRNIFHHLVAEYGYIYIMISIQPGTRTVGLLPEKGKEGFETAMFCTSRFTVPLG